MRLLRHRFKGYYLFFVVLLAVATIGSVTVYADSGPATVAVRAGSLTEANAAN